MEDLKKVGEFLKKVKSIKIKPLPVSQKQAAKLMGCSTRTVREYAKRYNVRLIEGFGGEWHYHLHGVQKMALAKEYNNVIRRFLKKSDSGYYKR